MRKYEHMQQQYLQQQERVAKLALRMMEDLCRHEVRCVRDFLLISSNQLKEVEHNQEVHTALEQYIRAILPTVCNQFHAMRNTAIELVMQELSE